MTILIISNAMAAAVFISVATVASFSAASANASMTEALQNCKYNSKQKTIQCCEQIVKRKRPLWMVEANQSCNTAVVCVPSKYSRTAVTYLTKPRLCFVKIDLGSDNGTSSTPSSRRNQFFK